MTVFFVASHDEATHANLAVAQQIDATTDRILFGADATRAGLHEALTLEPNDRTAFLMGHGSKDALYDSHEAVAVQATDSPIFQNCRVFAWACFTGARLGHTMAQNAVTWWGYDCAVTAPDGRPQFAEVFAEIFEVVKRQFSDAMDAQSVHMVIEQIRVACESAAEKLDELQANYDAEAFALYSCCRQIWQRLSVWLTGYQAPLRHDFAPPAYIDI